jgi:Tfp pilus assembly protein PilN
MIRINLLADHQRKGSVGVFDQSRVVPLACAAVMLAAGAIVGLWYWHLASVNAALDAQTAEVRQQVAQIQPIIREVRAFEERRTQLKHRVEVIQQLRDGQGVPVQLLEHVSHSVPEMLWLTEMGEKDADLTIEGRTTTLISLSDFVGNLGNAGVLRKPIELISSQVEASGSSSAPGVDVIKFAVKAQIAAGPNIPPAVTAKANEAAKPAGKQGAR